MRNTCHRRRHRWGRRCHRGASSVEYALLAALVAVVVIGSVTFFGSQAAALFEHSCSSLPGTSAC